MAAATSAKASLVDDSGSMLVVKRTFLELVDKTDGLQSLGACRRVSSDPGLFESCEQEQLRFAAANDGNVEFDMTGLSDTETNPGDVAPAASVDAGTADSSDPSENGSDEPPCLLADAQAAEDLGAGAGAPAPGSGGALPEDLQLSIDGDSSLSRLVSENARLALENKLLRENARLALENKMLHQGMGGGSAAFASWWGEQCRSQDGAEEHAAPPPSHGFPKQQRDQASRAWEGQAALSRRPNRQQDQGARMQAASGSVSDRNALAQVGEGEFSMAEHEQRTTVMLRNLPNNYSRAMVLAMLNDEGFSGKYNFLYLPIDFKSRACLGYAFINLIDAETTAAMWNTFNGYSKWMLPSKKICSVSWSGPHQGLQAHIERYRNSPVMHPSVPDEYKPVVFEDGLRIVFPAPTKSPRVPRIRNHREHA